MTGNMADEPRPTRRPSPESLLTLFLCGDVMTGRGIDQVLPHPSDPRIYEPYVQSAETYVRLAERANGPIPHPVDFSYIWGDALAELAHPRPDARIINLETSITRSDDHWPDKGIHYRMHPDTSSTTTKASPVACLETRRPGAWRPQSLSGVCP